MQMPQANAGSLPSGERKKGQLVKMGFPFENGVGRSRKPTPILPILIDELQCQTVLRKVWRGPFSFPRHQTFLSVSLKFRNRGMGG